MGKILAVVLASLLVAAHADSPIGTISGIVLDDSGLPLAGASVEAEPEGILVRARAPVVTDKLGQFTITKLPLKTYKIYVSKPSEFYPDMGFAFYSRSVTNVVLQGNTQNVELVIRLGPRAGRISGQTVDRLTGSPIPATFRMSRKDDTKAWYAVSQPADFQLLLPTDTAVTLQVEARGYKPWIISDVRLQAKEARTLRIELDPE